MTRTRPEDGSEQLMDLEAGGLATAGSSDTARPLHVPLPTATRLPSKVMSKFTPVTSVPAEDDRLSGTAIPVSPGAPEPEPTDSVALAA